MKSAEKAQACLHGRWRRQAEGEQAIALAQMIPVAACTKDRLLRKPSRKEGMLAAKKQPRVNGDQ